MRSRDFEDKEFRVTYRSSETVSASDVPPYEKREAPVTAREAAIDAVRRLVDGFGPEGWFVDVVDEQGVVCKFDLYRWKGDWVCEVRADDPDTSGRQNGPELLIPYDSGETRPK